MEMEKIEGNNPFKFESRQEFPIGKQEVTTNILDWIQNNWQGNNLPTKEDFQKMGLTATFEDHWDLQDHKVDLNRDNKGNQQKTFETRAYVNRVVIWKFTMNGREYNLPQVLATSVEYPKEGLIRQEEALNKANFAIRLYTATMIRSIRGENEVGFSMQELAKSQFLRFDFGKDRVFNKHSMVQAYHPGSGSKATYSLPFKLESSITKAFCKKFPQTLDEVKKDSYLPVIDEDKSTRFEYKVREMVNQEVEDLQKEDFDKLTPGQQKEVRELVCQKMRIANSKMIGEYSTLAEHPNVALKEELKKCTEEPSFLDNIPLVGGMIKTGKEKLQEKIQGLFGSEDTFLVQLSELSAHIKEEQKAIYQIKQDIELKKKELINLIEENQKQEKLDVDENFELRKNSINNQIEELKEKLKTLEQKLEPLEKMHRNFQKEAEFLEHQIHEHQEIFNKNLPKAQKIALFTLMDIAEKFYEKNTQKLKNLLPHDFSNKNDEDKLEVLLEILREHHAKAFQEKIIEDPSLNYLIKMVEGATFIQAQRKEEITKLFNQHEQRYSDVAVKKLDDFLGKLNVVPLALTKVGERFQTLSSLKKCKVLIKGFGEEDYKEIFEKELEQDVELKNLVEWINTEDQNDDFEDDD